MLSSTTSERSLEDYADIAGDDHWQRLRALAADLDGASVLHVNSTAAGGGVAELLRSLVPLFEGIGVDADWRVMEADDAFFEVTKGLHNGLQGEAITITDEMEQTYRRTTERNAAAVEGEFDVVVLHDPQTLGMVGPLAAAAPDTQFVWRCHIDLTDADRPTLDFLADFARLADHAIFTREEYRGPVGGLPSTIIHPSIDPLATKNRPLDDHERAGAHERLDAVPFDDAPVVTQVSRYDSWKDPLGVVEVHRRLAGHVDDVHLVLAGGMADDDPEGEVVYQRVAEAVADDPRVHLLTNESDETINALQRWSDVVLQKSLREGFGLVVSEALWKRTPVVGSNVGGIPLQVEHGTNGYLVDPDDTDAVVDRTAELLTDEDRRSAFGRRGRRTVREQFLSPRHLLDYGVLLRELL